VQDAPAFERFGNKRVVHGRNVTALTFAHCCPYVELALGACL
jgi:hypothetical protein